LSWGEFLEVEVFEVFVKYLEVCDQVFERVFLNLVVLRSYIKPAPVEVW
jgi:hypothetical protein